MRAHEVDLPLAVPRRGGSAETVLDGVAASVGLENRNLLDLGLDPITLEQELLTEVMEIAVRYRDRADVEKIPCTSLWVQRPQDAADAQVGTPLTVPTPA